MPQLFRPPTDVELQDDSDAGPADWDADDGEDVAIPEAGAPPPAASDDEEHEGESDDDGGSYDHDEHEDYSDAGSDGDSIVSIDREELVYGTFLG